MPARTGNFAMRAVEPVDQHGLKPSAITSRAVSNPSAICNPSSTSSSRESRTMPAGEPSVFAGQTLRPSRM